MEHEAKQTDQKEIQNMQQGENGQKYDRNTPSLPKPKLCFPAATFVKLLPRARQLPAPPYPPSLLQPRTRSCSLTLFLGRRKTYRVTVAQQPLYRVPTEMTTASYAISEDTAALPPPLPPPPPALMWPRGRTAWTPEHSMSGR
jgi:hypothetical protein